MKLSDQKLQEYRALAAFLGSILGEDYAIALFDADQLPDRQADPLPDQPAAQLAEARTQQGLLLRPLYQTEEISLDPGVLGKALEAARFLPFDYLCGFTDKGKMPEIEKAAIFPIRDEQGEAIGYLYFLKKFTQKVDLKAVVENMMKNETEGKDETSEAAENGMDAAISRVIYEKTAEIYEPYRQKGKLKKKEKVDLVRELFEAGITKLRGGMGIIAEVTGIPQASLYRYLMEVIEE